MSEMVNRKNVPEFRQEGTDESNLKGSMRSGGRAHQRASTALLSHTGRLCKEQWREEKDQPCYRNFKASKDGCGKEWVGNVPGQTKGEQ